jgi:hypothetical protein
MTQHKEDTPHRPSINHLTRLNEVFREKERDRFKHAIQEALTTGKGYIKIAPDQGDGNPDRVVSSSQGLSAEGPQDTHQLETVLASAVQLARMQSSGVQSISVSIKMTGKALSELHGPSPEGGPTEGHPGVVEIDGEPITRPDHQPPMPE